MTPGTACIVAEASVTLVREILGSERGSIAIHIAVSIIVIIGMVALGVEVTFLLYVQRQLQSVADSAALGGATALAAGYPSATVEAQAIAASLGFANGSNGTSVVVNNPPSGGPHAGDSNYVEAIVSQPQTLSLISLFISPVINVGARAVAFKGAPTGNTCVLSLAAGNVGSAVSASGNSSVNLNGCSLGVNSTSNSSITVRGNSTISALAAVTAGKYSTNGNAQLNVTDPPVQTDSTNVPSNPYSGFSVPTPGSCLRTGYSLSGNNSATLSQGTYCNGISVSANSSLTLNPGVYIINDGSLTVSGNATLTATGGVSIVLTGSSSSEIGTFNFGGNTEVDIVAPGSGSMAGIALFQDPKAPTGNANSLVGNTDQVIEGAIYLPSGQVTYTGNSSSVSACIELIAWTITFNGNSNFQLNCPSVPILPIGGTGGTPQLAE